MLHSCPPTPTIKIKKEMKQETKNRFSVEMNMGIVLFTLEFESRGSSNLQLLGVSYKLSNEA